MGAPVAPAFYSVLCEVAKTTVLELEDVVWQQRHFWPSYCLDRGSYSQLALHTHPTLPLQGGGQSGWAAGCLLISWAEKTL